MTLVPRLGGTAQLSVLGDRATVTLRNTPPDALAQWLAQVRINARLIPLPPQLTREPGNPGWSGTVVLSGPSLGQGS
jgi:general secretion pathway protein M